MNTGGPAFPFTRRDSRSDQIDDQYEGMTIRDWFAGQALAALISHPKKDPRNCGKDAVSTLAEFAYGYADAMLLERDK